MLQAPDLITFKFSAKKIFTFFPPFRNSRTLLWFGTVRSCSSPPGLGPALALQNSKRRKLNIYFCYPTKVENNKQQRQYLLKVSAQPLMDFLHYFPDVDKFTLSQEQKVINLSGSRRTGSAIKKISDMLGGTLS